MPVAVSTSLFVEGSHNLPLKENVANSIKFKILLSIAEMVSMYFFSGIRSYCSLAKSILSNPLSY